MKMIISLFLLVPMLSLGIPNTSAVAQVATPGVDEVATECRHPELPPGTPTPVDAATPEAAPDEEAEAATPADSVEAMAATPDPDEGTLADQVTIDRVLEAELNLFHCFNTGDFLGAAALYTPEALLENLGVSNPYDLPALLAGDETQLELIEIRNVRVLPDGRIRYEDRYRFGDTIYSDLNYMIEREGFLLLAKTIPLAQEAAAQATPGT